MIISIILAIWRKDWVWVVGTIIGLLISLLPSIIKKDIMFTLPWLLDFLIAFVSILHIGGRLLDYYYTIPGYQIVTRFFISVLVAFIALSISFILDEHWDGLKMNKYAMGFVTIIFTITIGVFFEIIKWANVTGSYYEKTYNSVMFNLSTDIFAGITIAIIGVNLIKSGKFDKMTDSFSTQFDKMIIDKLEKREIKKK